MATAPAIPKEYERIALAEHLVGGVEDSQFKVSTVETKNLGDDEVFVRIDFVQVVTAFTDLMRADPEIPMPPYQLDDTVGGAVVGTVLESRSVDFEEGDLVFAFTGWSEYQVAKAEKLTKLDRNVVPSPAYYLNQGITAYYGMADVAKTGPGDVVYVSGAAGGVGSLAGQIAKIRGAAKVIGSAGTDEKVRYLVEDLHFDGAFNYKTGDLVQNIKSFAPDGIDVFFDNVGGDQFEAAIRAAKPNARFALCGALSSQVSKDAGDWPRLNLMTAITKNLSIFPFATYHTPEQIQNWATHFGMWLSEGKLVFPHTGLKGPLTDAPTALKDLISGKYRGNVALEIEHS
ncbi:MDR family NADP-dependent oxidoreductase [Rhodococcus marinonascens]|uniref:MDR family NADP-dependent oxidoreductase n=1 Tax=Rhodococcus marinonascens TaxID=38311 RepID=UPI000933EC0F|nr:NADP-dependent oxidoreductase [Rhodococcus marinonascens]